MKKKKIDKKGMSRKSLVKGAAASYKSRVGITWTILDCF